MIPLEACTCHSALAPTHSRDLYLVGGRGRGRGRARLYRCMCTATVQSAVPPRSSTRLLSSAVATRLLSALQWFGLGLELEVGVGLGYLARVRGRGRGRVRVRVRRLAMVER